MPGFLEAPRDHDSSVSHGKKGVKGSLKPKGNVTAQDIKLKYNVSAEIKKLL